ncbi:MAG: F0F1 ATP synthase subunit delta [Nocardioidaceae bacterium]|jgi:F-type H+-transporting ATPase subunit delta
MRGASADSLAALTEELGPAKGLVPTIKGWASKLTGATGHSEEDDASLDARMAEDLFGVADVLRREPSLRRTVTDVSVPAEAKARLARQIFERALAAESMDLVASAVSRRWAASRDLADSLEYLGVVCVLRSAERRGEADALEDELFGFGRIVADNPDLRDALSDPARSTDDKRRLIKDLLEGRTTAATIRLAQETVAGTHRTVALAVEAYQKIVAEHRNRLVATVRVARELSEQESARLANALERQYGRPVHVNMMIDPGVMGGIRVEIGDDVIDGTVSSRLDDARRQLAG